MNPDTNPGGSTPRYHLWLVAGGIAVTASMILPIVSLVFRNANLLFLFGEDLVEQRSTLRMMGAGTGTGSLILAMCVVAGMLGAIPLILMLPPSLLKRSDGDAASVASVAPWLAATNLLIAAYVLVRLDGSTNGLQWGAAVLLGGLGAQIYGSVLFKRETRIRTATVAPNGAP